MNLILNAFILSAQNLVPNPSFEVYNTCPRSFIVDYKKVVVPGWVTPDKGTPDYYNRCSRGDASVPTNWAGNADPVTGKGYIGIYAWRVGGYREHIQAKLTKPLEKGKKYEVGFYLNQTINAQYYINSIGILFNDTEVDSEDYFHTAAEGKLIEVDLNPSVKVDWELIKTEYVALGGERYITIGKFEPLNTGLVDAVDYRYKHVEMLNSCAYAYIDDVFVNEVQEPMEEQDSIQIPIVLGKPFELQHVYFEFNSDELTTQSYPYLDSLSEVVLSIKYNMVIVGHTDDIGTTEYNYILALKRAQSVVDYLIKMGVDPAKLKSESLGEDVSLSTNSSEEGRSLNRRVEVTFLEGE